MRLRPVPLALFATVVLAHGEVRAQMLPPPHVMPSANMLRGVLPPAGRPVPTLPLAALPYPVPGYQSSAYQVWQNYGVTYNGWLRPRIYQTPYGAYWLYNGAPFPYAYTMPGRYMPAIGPAGAPGP